MKKTNIIIIVGIAVLMGVMIVSLMGNTRNYATFAMAGKHNKSYDIVGTLDTTKSIIYNAKVNPDEFSFYMKDQDNKEAKVVVSKPKPQDFQRSTQVVVSGKMKGDVFYASSILLKCPSKYEGSSPAAIKTKPLGN